MHGEAYGNLVVVVAAIGAIGARGTRARVARVLGAPDFGEVDLDASGGDTRAAREVSEGLLSDVEALARGGVDALDDDRLAIGGQLPAASAKGRVPLDAVDTANVGEERERAQVGVA